MLLANLGSKLKGDEVPSGKPSAVIVCETLMIELESQMKEIETLQAKKEQEDKRRHNTADYSWLISTSRNDVYQISPVDRLVLEELASKVRPEDSGEVISQFRTVIETRPFDISEIPTIFRCVIERHLSEQVENSDESTLKWLSRSLSELGSSIKTIRSHSSSKVFPIARTLDVESNERTRRVKSMPEFVAMRDLPV